jgi:general L-amino acid transport system permease protein
MMVLPTSEANNLDNSLTGKVPFWLDPKKRSIIYQLGALCLVGLLAYYLVSNTLFNLEKQSIATGWGFLNKESAFEIGESLIPYSAANTYGHALLVGALNTLKVAFIGIIITIILGTIVGVARLSSNWLVSRLAAIYRGDAGHPDIVAAFFLVCHFLRNTSITATGPQPHDRSFSL